MIWTVVGLFVGLAILLGTGIVIRPDLAIPFSFEVGILSAVTIVLTRRVMSEDNRGTVSGVLLWAFALRLAALIGVHFTLSPYFFAPDASLYEQWGRQLANAWAGLGPVPPQASGILPNYVDLNAVFIWLTGDSSIAAPILNVFVGTWTVLVVYVLTRDLVGERSAKWAAVVTASFPSLVLWSVLNIRDALATFVVTAVVYLGIRLLRRPSGLRIMMLILALLALQALRDYMAFLVAAGLVLGVAAATRRQRLGPTLAIGTLGALFATIGANQLGLFSQAPVGEALETAAQLREGLMVGAGSSYGAQFDTSSLSGALAFLPRGLAFLLFAPFPWRIESTLQAVAMPETLLWYPLFLFSVIGIRRVAERSGRDWLVPASVLLIVVTSYALVEGNFGTAYRHRAQIMPLFFVFASVGLQGFVRWFQNLVSRRRPRSLGLRRGTAEERR
jgi:dolichyl-phosphate-mannose-protein mannosyltransferase